MYVPLRPGIDIVDSRVTVRCATDCANWQGHLKKYILVCDILLKSEFLCDAFSQSGTSLTNATICDVRAEVAGSIDYYTTQ